MKAKYIVVDDGVFEKPYLFSEFDTHSDIARAIGGEVVGAGFCSVKDDMFDCWGESVSCGVKSRGEIDSRVLNKVIAGKVY